MMSRNLPYRKYRPVVHVHRNAPIWSGSYFDFNIPQCDECIVTFCSLGWYRWNYAITCVLEIDVKPRLHMWSWQHIRCHRQMVKSYKKLYKTKITSKKPTEELLKALEVSLHLSCFILIQLKNPKSYYKILKCKYIWLIRRHINSISAFRLVDLLLYSRLRFGAFFEALWIITPIFLPFSPSIEPEVHYC